MASSSIHDRGALWRADVRPVRASFLFFILHVFVIIASVLSSPGCNKVCSTGKYCDNGCVACAPGKYSDTTNATTCRECDEGQYQNDLGGGQCKECEKGQYQNEKGKDSCTACARSEYQDKKGKSKCERCSAGKIVELSSKPCRECGEGKFNNGNNACENCTEGKSKSTDETQCVQCSAGLYQSEQGKSKCVECDRGKYVALNKSACADCPKGWFRNETEFTLCKECPDGYFSGDKSSKKCTICNEGQYQPEHGQSQCKECDRGQYQSEKAMKLCKFCKKGHYQAKQGQKKCEQCDSGKYSIQSGSEICDECEEGKFSRAGDKCQDCPRSQFTDESGQSTCQQCPEGYFQSHTQSTTCNQCQPAIRDCKPKSANDWPSHVCDQIPDADRTKCIKPEGWKQSQDCKKGYYLNTSAGTDMIFNRTWLCYKCLYGADCALEIVNEDDTREFHQSLPFHALGNKVGFWNVTWWQGNDGLPLLEPCPFPNSCRGKKRWSIKRQNETLVVVKHNWTMETVNVSYADPVKDYVKSCTSTTTGVMCAVCRPYHYRVSALDADCQACTTVTAQESMVAFFLILSALLILVAKMRRRISKFRRKHVKLWRNICRLIVIVVNYIQIGTSLPAVIDIPWPSIHLKFLQYISFVNIDLVSLLGLRCIALDSSVSDGNTWDYRLSILLAGMATILSTLLILVSYKIAQQRFIMHVRRRRHRQQKQKRESGNICEGGPRIQSEPTLELKYLISSMKFIYETVDIDHRGFINEVQFRKLLIAVNYKRSKKKRKAMKDLEIENLMRSLGATFKLKEERQALVNKKQPDIKATKRKSTLSTRIRFSRVLTHSQNPKQLNSMNICLSEESLGEAVKSGSVVKLFGYSWAIRSEVARIRSLYFSILISVLFFLHAPVSQKFFHYFSCRGIGDRLFLRMDYSLECYRGKHADFSWIVVSGMALFTFGLPLYIAIQFCKNRKRLHSPLIMHRYGFLYSNFVKGAEFWELHELARKLLLIGFLVFIRKMVHRASVATVICVAACCSLNYVRPHSERVIIWVDQASFLLTTLKYFIIVLMDTQAFQNEAGTRQPWVGSVLLGIDVTFLVLACILVMGLFIMLFNPSQTRLFYYITNKLGMKRLGKENKLKETRCSPLVEEHKENRVDRHDYSEKKLNDPNAVTKRKSLTNMDFTKVLTVRKADEIISEFESSRTKAVNRITVHKSESRSRLLNRLEKRKSFRAAQATVQVSVHKPAKKNSHAQPRPLRRKSNYDTHKNI